LFSINDILPRWSPSTDQTWLVFWSCQTSVPCRTGTGRRKSPTSGSATCSTDLRGTIHSSTLLLFSAKLLQSILIFKFANCWILFRLIHSAISLQDNDKLPQLPPDDFAKGEDKLRDARNFYVRVSYIILKFESKVIFIKQILDL